MSEGPDVATEDGVVPAEQQMPKYEERILIGLTPDGKLEVIVSSANSLQHRRMLMEALDRLTLDFTLGAVRRMLAQAAGAKVAALQGGIAPPTGLDRLKLGL